MKYASVVHWDLIRSVLGSAKRYCPDCGHKWPLASRRSPSACQPPRRDASASASPRPTSMGARAGVKLGPCPRCAGERIKYSSAPHRDLIRSVLGSTKRYCANCQYKWSAVSERSTRALPLIFVEG